MNRSHIPTRVLPICQAIEMAGFEAWVVGGCVRDTILGRRPNDWDVTTNATPEEVTKIFKNIDFRVEPTGIQHGTVTVIAPSDRWHETTHAVEVTTFRGDGEYTDGRRPDSVTFVKTIEEDLARRDFTINAMAFRPEKEIFVDPFKGMQAIKDRLIVAVGDPNARFAEDGLRVMRACRFAAQLDFGIQIGTLAAMRKPKATEKCLAVARERIYTEFFKLITASNPSIGLHAMRHAGLLGTLFPSLKVQMDDNFDKKFNGLHAFANAKNRTFALRTAALLYPIGDAKARDAMIRLRAPTDFVVEVATLIKGFQNAPADCSGASCRAWAAEVGKKEAVAAIDLLEAFGDKPSFVSAAREVLVTDPPLAVGDLVLNGMQVAEILDVKPGRVVGEALRFLLSEVIKDPEMNKQYRLTKWLMQHAAEFQH